MRICSFAVSCLFLVLPAATAQTDARDQVLKVNAAFDEAKLHNDVAALDRILADGYIGINQWGARRDRQQALELFRAYRTSSLVPSNVTVHVSGDTATVDGIMCESGQWTYSFLRTYVKRDGRWQLLAMAQPFSVNPDTMSVFVSVHPVTGRHIPLMMGVGEASYLVQPAREKQDEPDKALAALDIAKGATVADVGAAVGYYSWRLAKIVGPTGKVYAIDVQAELLEQLKKNMQERALTNVVPVLGTADDPRLPRGAIDLVLMVDAYHEFSQPQRMLDRIGESLRPDGRLVLIERRREDIKDESRAMHAMSVADAKAEFEAQGYRLDKTLEILPSQHIMIFRVAH